MPLKNRDDNTMKKNKSSSLVNKLTLLLGINLTCIWFIATAMNVFFSFENTTTRLIKELENKADLQVGLINQLFQTAERDALLLTQIDEIAPHNAKDFSGSFIQNQTCNRVPLLSSAQNILQVSRMIDQKNYFFSFIIQPEKGIALFTPKTLSHQELIKRQNELLDLLSGSPKDNIFWGKPVYVKNDGWHLSLALCNKHGGFSGIALNINRFFSHDPQKKNQDIHLLLDEAGDLLASSHHLSSKKTINHLLKELRTIKLHDGLQQTENFLVWRLRLPVQKLQQLIVYPRANFLKEAAQPALDQLPFAICILVLLTLTVFFLLRYYLAVPLWNFVKIISTTGTESMEKRLPMNRHHELGRIAQSYNDLLDILNKQYDTLETRVNERTLQLKRAKQVAERANRRKSLHLTTISHEIRTPLNGALGAIELLKHTSLSPSQLKLLDTTQQCSSSLLSIINALLDFSHIESGQMTLVLEQTELLPILDQAMLTIQSQAFKHSLNLYTFVSKEVPLVLKLDALRLRQILINLLGNAVKFTQKGSISLYVQHENHKLCFTVEDTGCGIDEKFQKKIFQPFFQAGINKGTGLGLTIASNLASLMKGTLDLQSTLNLGTRVCFEIPVNEKYAPPTIFSGSLSAPSSLIPQLNAWGIACLSNNEVNPKLLDKDLIYLPGRLYSNVKKILFEQEHLPESKLPVQPWKMSVLLVDDSEINLKIIGMMLSELGHDVELAHSGDEALELAHHQRFDLVLMDIRMPKLNGLQTTRLWRTDLKNRDRECMIVALTANASPSEKQRVCKAGMNDYLCKPVTIADLAGILDLTAQFQIKRDISLVAQVSTLKPVLDTKDKNLISKIYLSMSKLAEEIAESIHNPDPVYLADHLHKLKGCAGQAGFIELQEKVVELEKSIHENNKITEKDIKELKNLIKK